MTAHNLYNYEIKPHTHIPYRHHHVLSTHFILPAVIFHTLLLSFLAQKFSSLVFNFHLLLPFMQCFWSLKFILFLADKNSIQLILCATHIDFFLNSPMILLLQKMHTTAIKISQAFHIQIKIPNREVCFIWIVKFNFFNVFIALNSLFYIREKNDDLMW